MSVLAIRQGYTGYNVLTVDWSEYADDILYNTKVIPQLRIVSNIFTSLGLFTKDKRISPVFNLGKFQSFSVNSVKLIMKLIFFSCKIAKTFADLLHQFLENGYDVERLHLAGHSLG